MNIASRYIDESFDINNCLNYTLSIRFAPDGFSFAVFDHTAKKFIVFSSYKLNAVSSFMLNNSIIDIVSSEPILQNRFKKVNALYNGANYTLAPLSLTDVKTVDQFYRFSFEAEREEVVISRELPNGVLVTSSIPKVIKKKLEELYPNVVFYSPICPIISYATCNLNNRNKVYAEISPHLLNLVVFVDGKLNAANYFRTLTDDDVLYYCLNMVKKLPVQLDELVITGETESRSNIVMVFKKYFKNVKMAAYSDLYQVSNSFKDMQAQMVLPTIDLALCE